jgi:DNA-directed RNA polymerase specialized sigma24 family protein
MDESISRWIGDLKQGDIQAAQRLWDRFFGQLVGFARARMKAAPRKAADEEDVALSVFDSLCRGAARGQFTKLSDRNDLRALLLVLTTRKVCDYVARERRQKRGGGRATAFSELDSQLDPLEAPGREPDPQVAAILREESERIFSRLDGDLRRIALGKLEGYSNRELASQLNCGLRTVERRLEIIRRIWTEGGTPG